MDLGCPCSSPEISLDLLGYSNKSINFRDLGCPCSSPEISPEYYRDTVTIPPFSRDLVCPNSSPEIS